MQREQVAKTIGCTTESLRRWYAEGKKRGLVAKLGKSTAAPVAGAAVTVESPVTASSAPLDPGAGLGEHEVKAILDYKRRHPSMGPAQIRAQLKRFLGWRVAVKAIARVLRKAGFAPVHRKGRPSVTSTRVGSRRRTATLSGSSTSPSCASAASAAGCW